MYFKLFSVSLCLCGEKPLQLFLAVPDFASDPFSFRVPRR